MVDLSIVMLVYQRVTDQRCVYLLSSRGHAAEFPRPGWKPSPPLVKRMGSQVLWEVDWKNARIVYLIYIYICIYVYMYMHINMYVYVYIITMSMSMSFYVYVCAYNCIYVYVRI